MILDFQNRLSGTANRKQQQSRQTKSWVVCQHVFDGFTPNLLRVLGTLFWGCRKFLLGQRFSKCEARLPWGAPESFRGGAAKRFRGGGKYIFFNYYLSRYFKTLPDWIRVILIPADWDVQIPPAPWITDRKQEMERTFNRKKEKLAQLLCLNLSIILVSVDAF